MNSDSWCSPREVVDPLHELWPGGIDLDPCSNERSIVRARTAWTIGALQRTWFADRWRSVYANPPYSNLRVWVPYAVRQWHLAGDRHLELVMLVPVATSTDWWQYLLTAEALVFTPRLKFIGDKNSTARFDTVLAYWGARSGTFCKAFAPLTRWLLRPGFDAERLRLAEHMASPEGARTRRALRAAKRRTPELLPA